MRKTYSIGIVLILVLAVAAGSARTLAFAQEKQDFSNIKNFLRVNEKICTGGQPTMDDLARLKADGVKAIINLRQASEYKEEDEATKAKELGLRYIHIPVNRDALKPEMAEEFLKQMSDPANRPAFVHCGEGNRVGAFWMIYRVLKDGWKVEDAEEEAKKIGMRSTSVTREFALEYIRTHEKKPDQKPQAFAQEKQDFSNIKNFLRVNDKICTGGQPTMDDLARMKADGVKAIINLRQASEFNAEEEAAKAKELGLRYIHIPVNREALEPEMADEFLKQISDPANRPAFVHCTTANRVGAFWMIYRVLKDGWKVEDAEEEARTVGTHSPELFDFAREYIRTHEKKPDKKPQ